MTKRLEISLLIFGVLGSVALAGFSTISITQKLYRWYDPYLVEDIAGPTTVTPEWLEIKFKSPLRVERQIYAIALDLDKSIHMEVGGTGLVLPDDLVVKPEVQLIGDDGVTYELDSRSFFLANTGETLAKFSRRDLPKDRSYIKLRIRSEHSFSCRRIFWRNYNQWDAESAF